MKRIIVSIILSLVLVICSSISSKAAVLGTLYVWHSDSSSIGTFYPTTVLNVYCQNLSSSPATSFPFLPSVSHAMSAWSNALGITITLSSSSSHITVYGGTSANLESMGYSFNFDIYSGMTVIDNSSYDGIWNYVPDPDDPSLYEQMLGYQHYHATCLILDETGWGENHYKNVAMHEMGHALGWKGHASHVNDIMYHLSSSYISLSSRDIAHLVQVY